MKHQELSLVNSLKKFKLTQNEIELFMSYSDSKKITLLQKQRKVILNQIHDYYKCIDQLDYLINEYKGGKENGRNE